MRELHWFLVFTSLLLITVESKTMCAQTTRGIMPEDYFSFEVISDPHLSPDGKDVAYVLTTVDQKRNRRESSVWLLTTDGSAAPRRLSAEEFNSTYPRWSPDGKTLAILSARNSDSAAREQSKEQIYLLPTVRSGEGLALTTLKNGVQSYQWSPDGTRIVVVSLSGPRDGIAEADRKSDVRHYSHIIYKFNDTGWDDGKRQHLWVVNAQDREINQITDGQDWNDTDPQWAPDSTRIAFVSDRTGKAYDTIRNNTDVWVVPATGGSLTKISDHDFADESPRWSPDGKQILLTGKTAYHQFPKLYIANSNGSGTSQLAVKDLDLIPTELHWFGAGSVLFQARVKGEAQIVRANLASRTLSNVTSGSRQVHEFDVNESAGELIYLADDFQHLDDLYIANLNGTGERQLTQLNSKLLARLDPQPVERLNYKSNDGWPIEGFFVKPLGWQAGKKYPLILVIHGGPRDMYGVGWNHEFQIYAAKGWAVFFCNPRGSIGYGEKFERGEINNWGVMDYEDIMAGVDTALKQYPWTDPKRLGVTGGSYGGYMTNWIVSHNNRFKAAVTLRSECNFISVEGTRWQPYGHEEYFKGVLFDDLDQYWEASPLKYSHNVRTPTLILHSELDFQIPLEEDEQWFRALQHYGVPSELVIFPRENHNLTRTGEPRHIVESLNWRIYWFDRYLYDNANAKPPDAQ